MREKLIEKMKNIFGDDQKRIEHALAVLDYAEQIQNVEGGDPLIVRAAAILHDIGIHEAQRKHDSSAGRYQEIEGPLIAREILGKYGLDEGVIEHVCKIIANHHSAKDIDTLEFRVVWDADWLVNIPAELPNPTTGQLEELIGKVFKTPAGRKIATELFVKEQNETK
jgi:putative nucleotidyltransferase with HDIG domain